MEAPLAHWQPEARHSPRINRRIEEQLLAANMVIDKPLLANTRLWIVTVSLNFWKRNFDRVDWMSL